MSGSTSGRLHGRHQTNSLCARPGCDQPGEFRAPAGRPGGDQAPQPGPPRWQYLCLEHVREFNAGYNWFEGMTPEEVYAAQNPYPQWDRATRAFARSPTGPDRVADALGILKWRDGERRRGAAVTPGGRVLSAPEARALRVLGLDASADLKSIKAAYRAAVRRFHPDSNGGDRSKEDRLREAVDAHDLLNASGAFA